MKLTQKQIVMGGLITIAGIALASFAISQSHKHEPPALPAQATFGFEVAHAFEVGTVETVNFIPAGKDELAVEVTVGLKDRKKTGTLVSLNPLNPESIGVEVGDNVMVITTSDTAASIFLVKEYVGWLARRERESSLALCTRPL